MLLLAVGWKSFVKEDKVRERLLFFCFTFTKTSSAFHCTLFQPNGVFFHVPLHLWIFFFLPTESLLFRLIYTFMKAELQSRQQRWRSLTMLGSKKKGSMSSFEGFEEIGCLAESEMHTGSSAHQCITGLPWLLFLQQRFNFVILNLMEFSWFFILIIHGLLKTCHFLLHWKLEM